MKSSFAIYQKCNVFVISSLAKSIIVIQLNCTFSNTSSNNVVKQMNDLIPNKILNFFIDP